MSKKVLVVEDEKFFHDKWRNELGDKIILLSAFSIEDAEKQFASNSDIAAIVMDACVPKDVSITLYLVQDFRKTFTGPMIAASGSGEYRQQLIQAGCDHESKKSSVPQKILEVLGL